MPPFHVTMCLASLGVKSWSETEVFKMLFCDRLFLLLSLKLVTDPAIVWLHLMRGLRAFQRVTPRLRFVPSYGNVSFYRNWQATTHAC